MNISCIIVEDEPMARNLLEQYVNKVSSLTLVASFSNPLEALDHIRQSPPDVLFLDVQMSEITGISLLKILTNKPIVILTTAYSEYAIEGYELDVTDYLLKPITFERFLKAVEKASRILKRSSEAVVVENPANELASEIPSTNTNFIFVKDGTKLVKVKIDEIQYIEGLKDYVKIHTPNGMITTLQRMKNLEQELPSSQFIRIHHSYIVALQWIDVIHRERVEIGKKLIPISVTYRKAFKAFIDNRHLGKV